MESHEFTELVEKHSQLIRAFLWRRAGGLDVAISEVDDLAADVWTVVWQRRAHIPPLDNEIAVRAWLIQISRHILANNIRKTDTRRRISNTLKPEELTQASAEAIVLRDESLRNMFSLLTAGEQEVMALTLWEDLRPQEIAQALHLSENAVSLRLFKARAKIKKALENEKD